MTAPLLAPEPPDEAPEPPQLPAAAAPPPHPSTLLPNRRPAYQTPAGAAYCGDGHVLLSELPENSVDLFVTSPPYALEFKKSYGNASKTEYVDWFLPFGREVFRALKDKGSFVLNIGGSYNKGVPTRSLYHFKLVIALVEELGFHLAQEGFWYNPAKLPAPAEWVNVRRVRVKDSVEYVFWFSKTPWPKANNREVLVPYSPDMHRLIAKGFTVKERPSGWKHTAKWQKDSGGAIPSNLLERGNNESNSDYITRSAEHKHKVHPARFPAILPSWWTRFLTTEGDVVVDFFAGSNTTGSVAEQLKRRWLSFELSPDYVRNSALRFGIDPKKVRV